MYDRYSFDEQRVGFFYNEDPECRKLRGLEEHKKYIILFNGENSIPIVLEIDKDEVSLSLLIREVTLGVVKGTPRWG